MPQTNLDATALMERKKRQGTDMPNPLVLGDCVLDACKSGKKASPSQPHELPPQLNQESRESKIDILFDALNFSLKLNQKIQERQHDESKNKNQNADADANCNPHT